MAKRRKSASTQRSVAEVPPPARDARALAGAALIFVVTFIAYLPSLRGGFILDDVLLLTDNRLVKATDGLYRIWFTTQAIDYWPVTNSSFWLEWRLWGMQPMGYHVVSVLLHIAAALLIWNILQQLRIPGAFLAALLFALHPVNVESVAWIAQRKGMLAMLFFLLSIRCYLGALEEDRASRGTQTNRWYFLSLAAFLLAMLSKGSVAVLPVLLLAITAWIRPLMRRDLLWTAPFFAVAVAFTLVTMWFQARGVHVQIERAGALERLLGAGTVVWFYLSKAIWPFNLAFIYPKWHIEPARIIWWLPLTAAIATTAVLWAYRNSWGRAPLFAWGFVCVSLVPVMGFTDVTFMEYSLVADHYQHIALIGVMALVAGAWGTWQPHAQAPLAWAPHAAAAVAALTLAALTWRQSSFYSDSITLYSASLERNPYAWMAHNNLGAELFKVGRLAEAIEHDQRALELKPDYPEAHNNLGNVLSRTGRVPEAIAHYEEALRLRPTYVEAHNNLGSALAYVGRIPEGIAHFEEALRLKPDYGDARANLEVARKLAAR